MEAPNELYHHGVKGMSWGKRNGPPYPLYRKTSYYQKTGKRPPGYTGDQTKSRVKGLDVDISIGNGKPKNLSYEQYTKEREYQNRKKAKESKKRKSVAKKIAKGVAIGAGVAAASAIAYKNRDNISMAVKNSKLGKGQARIADAKWKRNSYASAANESRRAAKMAREYSKMSPEKLRETAELNAKSQEALSRLNPGSTFNKEEYINNFMKAYGKEAQSELAKAYLKKMKAQQQVQNRYNAVYKNGIKNTAGLLGATGAAVGAGAMGAKAIKNLIRDRKNEKGHIGSSSAMSDIEKREKRKKILKGVAIGTGVAAGAALGAYAGTRIYKNKAALGNSLVSEGERALGNATKRYSSAEVEAKNIANSLTAKRNKLVYDRYNLQTQYGNLAGQKGIRAAIRKRKVSKSISNLDKNLAENSKAFSNNKWALDTANYNVAAAKRDLASAQKKSAALKKLGKTQGIAAGLGITTAGTAAGYGASELLRRRKRRKSRRR